MNDPITITATIHAPLEKVWQYWSEPEHIKRWNAASDDWHTPHATNDFREGGRFTSRMEAKDGSMGFDFGGTHHAIRPHEYLRYSLDDGRQVEIRFEQRGDTCVVTESFEPEGTNPREMQQMGWQSILNNFKKHVEGGGLE